MNNRNGARTNQKRKHVSNGFIVKIEGGREEDSSEGGSESDEEEQLRNIENKENNEAGVGWGPKK